MAILFLPDRFVDPYERVLGEWRERALKALGEVTVNSMAAPLPGGGARLLSCGWVDGEDSSRELGGLLRLGSQTAR